MLRLLTVAIVSLAAFPAFLLALSRLVNSDEAAVVVAAVLLSFVGTPALLLRLWRPASAASKCPGAKGLYPECLFAVTVSSGEVRVTHPRRPAEAVALAELEEVQIVTNDSGPFGADLWWLLVGPKNTGCSFPGGASGENAVLELVQRLPGFKNEVFIQAMGSTSNARFSCWRAGT